MKPPIPRPRIAPVLALAVLLAAGVLAGIAAALLPLPPDAAAQSSSSKSSPCRKETGTAYPGGKGSPHFQGIPNADSYEPVTDTSGRRAVVRDLIEVFNLSTANCSWKVVSKDKNWVSLNTESGTVLADKHDTIQVSINSNAKSLRPGTYKSRIKFQLGPESDKWHAYATVILEILDKCYIKVKDADRLDIAYGGRVARWQGVMGRPTERPLQHRLVVWNSSNSQCQLSAETSHSWLNVAFDGDRRIGKFGETALVLSADDRWNNLDSGTHQATITINDSIGGGDYRLYVVLETEHQPCELVIEGGDQLQFEAVARSVKDQEILINLTNRGVEVCDWQAQSNKPWLRVTPARDKLPGKGARDSITVAILDNAAANELKSSPGDGQPHLGAVTFFYIKSGLTQSKTVPVSLRLSKPPCEMTERTPKEMLLKYSPGAGVNPARHHLPIEISNAPDSAECRYQIELPNWLETVADDEADSDADADSGSLAAGQKDEITVGLNANSREAQDGQEEYDGFITLVVADAPDVEIPVRLETDCPAGEACAYLRTSHTKIEVGDLAEMTYTVISPPDQPVIARLTLDLPSGWEIDGEGFANKCSGICTATYDMPASDQRQIWITAYPNQDGEFPVGGRAEYLRMENGQAVPYASSQDTVVITVLPREGGDEPPPAARTPVGPTPTPMPDPTAAPAPTTTPAGDADTPTPEAATPVPVVPPAPPPAAAPPATDPSTNILLIGVIAAVAILALIVVALAVVVLRRGGTPAPPQGPPQNRPRQPQQPQPSRPAPTRAGGPGGPVNQRR